MQGIYGIYLATNLTADVPGRRKLRTLITYDKGGEWRLLEPPKTDSNGRPTRCTPASVSSRDLLYSVHPFPTIYVLRVVTNLENLEKSGNLKNCQNLREISEKFEF